MYQILMFWSPYDYYLNIVFKVCIKCWCFDFFFFQSLDKSKAQCIHDSQYYNILQVAVCKRSNHLTTIVYPLPSLNVSISVTHKTLMLHNAALCTMQHIYTQCLIHSLAQASDTMLLYQIPWCVECVIFTNIKDLYL